MKRLFTVVALLLSLSCVAQTGYKIDARIKGLKDTTAYLGYYYGESTYVKDTAKVNGQGAFTFDGKQKLPQGVYFLVLGTTRIFEMVIGDQQHFRLETSTDDYIKNMKIIGDDDNRLFFENMVFNMERHNEADPLVKILKDSTLKEDQKKDAREAFQKINERVMARQSEIITNYPSTVTARLIKATKPVIVPDPPKRANGSVDSTFQLRYYREHFFDNFDIADDALIRMPKPFYTEKLTEYLDKLFYQVPDSIMAAIDGLAARVKKNPETYKYLVWTCVYKYQKPAIMGLDEVYVRLVDKYYLSGEMDFWIDPNLKKSIKEYADKLRVSLIGKTGANLSMQDQNFQQRSMYDIRKKYTILYIFDPDCGHCREESPKLVSFYEKNKVKLNLEVFAVSADSSMRKMRDYIKEMKMTWITVNGPRSYVGHYGKLYYAETTPSLYILDEKKIIIAKGLQADKLEEFFTNYERFLQRKAALKAKKT
jgi:thiol-disulfide isomerase/thioredoxin